VIFLRRSSAFLIVLFVVCSFADAQDAKKIPRIGFLLAGSGRAYLDAFRQRMRDLGYIEGQNIGIEVRYAEASADRAAELAAELVRLKVDVILTVGTQATLIVRKATSTIPIVVTGAGDLLGAGLVGSLARPGGNVTGSTNIDPDLSAKRLDLLKESLPKLTRVAVLHHGGPGGDEQELKETHARAQILKIHLRALEVKDPNRFLDAYNTIKRDGADGLVIFHGSFTSFNRLRIIELSMNNRMPTMCGEPSWSEAGCLMSYGHDRTHQWRRAADFVDKILKGAKPADLPVEQPTKFELIINLKAAKQIGLTIPPNVLARADRVIR